MLRPKGLALAAILFVLPTLLSLQLHTGIGLPLTCAAEAPSTPVEKHTDEAKSETRFDDLGDALPTGALFRLGTTRFRTTTSIDELGHLIGGEFHMCPSGKQLA